MTLVDPLSLDGCQVFPGEPEHLSNVSGLVVGVGRLSVHLSRIQKHVEQVLLVR